MHQVFQLLTNKFVKKLVKKLKFVVLEKQLQILDCLKNMLLKKGGGINHRFNLSDEILIKENHISSKKI